jgi:hypothetical protein
MPMAIDRLDFYHVIIVYLTAYALAYPLGSLVSDWLTGKCTSRQPFFVRVPLYLSTGLTLSVVAYFIASLIALSGFTIAFVTAIAWLVYVGVLMRSKRTKRCYVRFREPLGLSSLAPLFLLMVSVFFFAASVQYMKWPPIGDIAELHGPLVALIQYQGHLPTTLDPLLENAPPAYPLGFHVLVATWNTLFNYYPAQIVLITGGLVVALIPPLIYSIVFIRTKSVLFASISYAFVYLIDPVRLDRWLVGYFYNGPYPSLLGYLIVLAFVSLLVSGANARLLSWSGFCRIGLAAFITSISLLLVYPGFASFTVAYLLGLSLFHLGTIRYKASMALRAVRKLGIARGFLLFSGGALLSYLGVSLLLGYLSTYVPELLLLHPGTPADPRAYELYAAGYAVPASFFVDNVNGMMMLVACVVAAYLLVFRRDLTLSLFYLVVFVPVDLSVFPPFSSYLAYLEPIRSVMMTWVLAWPMFLDGLSILFRDKGTVGHIDSWFGHLRRRDESA